MRGKKEIILVFLIIFSLVGLSLYTTYGLYTSLHDDTPDIDYDYSLLFEIGNNVNREITINENETKKIYLNIHNPYNVSFNYKIYYVIVEGVNNNLLLNYGDELDDSILIPDENISVPIIINNNSSSGATIKIMVKAGYENREIILSEHEYEISGVLSPNRIPSVTAINSNNNFNYGTDQLVSSLFTIHYNDSNNGTIICQSNNSDINNISQLDIGEHIVNCIVTNTYNLKSIASTNITITE